MKKLWRRATKNLNGKMLLVELALILFVVVNVLSASGINGFHEYIDMPTSIYMSSS